MKGEQDIETVEETARETSTWSKFINFIYQLNPLLSDDVQLKQSSLRERDRYYILRNIESTLREVSEEEEFSLRRTCLLMTAMVSIITGVFLMLWGLSATHLFNSYRRNYVLLAVGVLLICPGTYLLYFLIFPKLHIRMKMKEIAENKKKRASPNVVTDAIKRAQLAANSDRAKLAVIGRQNRHQYQIKAATMGEFVETMSSLTGMPVKHMLVMSGGETIKIDLDRTLEGGYGFVEGDIIDVFNKGGYDIMLQTTVAQGYRSVAGSKIDAGVTAVNWKAQASLAASMDLSKNQNRVHPLK
jgi:hypothetical protein